METQKLYSWKLTEVFNKTGETLIKVSAVLFAIAIPTSIALDNLATGIGILGLIFLIFTNKLNLPPFKPLTILILSELPHYITKPIKILKETDFKQYLSSYFIGFHIASSKNFLRKTFIILGISTTVLTFSIIFEALTGQNIKNINVSSLHILKEGLFRPKGLLNHALTTGGVIYTLFFLFSAISFYFKEKKFAIFSLLALIGLVFNQSRSYWLATSTFFFVIILPGIFMKNMKKYRKLAITGISLTFFLCLSVFLYSPLKSRLFSITDVKYNSSNKDRLTIWTSYFYSFKNDYSLLEILIGKGRKAPQSAIKFGKEACIKFYPENLCSDKKYLMKIHKGITHNIYLKYFSKYGLIGLLAYLYFWFFFLKENLKKFLKTKDPVFIIFFSGYVGFLIAGLFENNFTDAEVQTAILFTLGINSYLLSIKTS